MNRKSIKHEKSSKIKAQRMSTEQKKSQSIKQMKCKIKFNQKIDLIAIKNQQKSLKMKQIRCHIQSIVILITLIGNLISFAFSGPGCIVFHNGIPISAFYPLKKSPVDALHPFLPVPEEGVHQTQTYFISVLQINILLRQSFAYEPYSPPLYINLTSRHFQKLLRNSLALPSPPSLLIPSPAFRNMVQFIPNQQFLQLFLLLHGVQCMRNPMSAITALYGVLRLTGATGCLVLGLRSGRWLWLGL